MTAQRSSRAGRRPGPSGTRDAILAAARKQFGDVGYDRATLRSIGAAAGVDPALVLHFFGSKQRLFLSVVELPIDAEDVIPMLVAGDRASVGRRLAGFLLAVLDDPDSRNRITSMVRAAASEPQAAAMLRELLTRRVFQPLAAALGSEDAALRANLVGSQIVGLVMARFVVAVEPLASTDTETVVEAIAPTLQRYLVEPIAA